MPVPVTSPRVRASKRLQVADKENGVIKNPAVTRVAKTRTALSPRQTRSKRNSGGVVQAC